MISVYLQIVDIQINVLVEIFINSNNKKKKPNLVDYCSLSVQLMKSMC
jgi:hypothetical protein